MTIARVQEASAFNTTATATVSWPGSTTAGNLLIIALATTAGSVTTPSGWTLATSHSDGTRKVYLFYIPGSGSRSGSESVSLSVSSPWCMYILEYSGLDPTSPLDVFASNDGNSSTPDSGTTSTTKSVDLCIALLYTHDTTNTPFSSPTHGFSIVDQNQNGFQQISSCVLQLVQSSAGTANTSASVGSDNWVGLIVTFTPPPMPPYTAVAQPEPARARAGAEGYGIASSFVVPDVLPEWLIHRRVLPDRQTRLLIASPHAYALTSTFVPPEKSDDEAIRGRSLPDQLMRLLYAGRSTYVVAVSFVVQGEPPVQRHLFQDLAPNQPRAASIAYQVSSTFVVPDIFPEWLIRRRELPDLAKLPGTPRAVASAYVFPNFVVVPDTDQPASHRGEAIGVPEQPSPRSAPVAYVVVNPLPPQEVSVAESTYRESALAPEAGPGRLSSAAYWIPPRAIYLEDEPHTQSQRSPEIAPARARTAHTAYLVTASFVIGDAMPINRESLPHRAPMGPRSPAESYWRTGTFTVQSEPALQVRSLPDLVSPWSRAASPTYLVNAWFVIKSEPPIVLGLVLPDQVRLNKAAANACYVVTATFPPAAEPAIQVTSLPQLAPSSPKVARSVNWLDNRRALDEPIIGVLAVSQPQPPDRRVASRSHWLENRLALDEPIIGIRHISQPQIPSGRAAFGAYLITARVFDEFLSAERPRGFLDLQPRQLPRAGCGTYWIGQHPVIFESTSGTFPGPFYPERTEIFVAGPELAEGFTPGNEAANELP